MFLSFRTDILIFLEHPRFLRSISNAMTSQMGLFGKGSKNIQISFFFLIFFYEHGNELCKIRKFSKIKIFHLQLQYTGTGSMLQQQQHNSMENWGNVTFPGNDISTGNVTGGIFPNNKRLSQI